MNRTVILVLSLFLTFSLKAKTIVVSNQGRISGIARALKICTPGDTIVVEKGNYYEPNLKITIPLVLTGVDFPVIENNDNGEIITIESDNVIISGFHLKNVKVSYIKDLAAIKVNRGKNCQLENNRLENTFFGIFLNHSRNCIIKDNVIIGNAVNEMSSGNAIHLWYCRNMLIENNEARNHRDGIYLEFVDSSHVVRNVVEDNIRYGLHFMFSDHDSYVENTFRANGAGVAVMFSQHIEMYRNKFEHNWGSSSYGLLLKDITDSKIVRNRFLKNTIGIYAEGSNRIDIQGNDFEQNGWAIKMYGSSMYNRIYKNNFLHNSFELSTNSRSSTNNYNGNYWSQYTGYDLDKNGTGDVPYRPMKLFSRIIAQIPSSTILMRSLLIDVINFAEKVSPIFIPDNLMDREPLIKKIDHD